MSDRLRAFAKHVLNEQVSHGEQGDAEYIRMAREALDADRYNGWTNRETFHAHLWLSNDVQNVRWIEDLVADYRREAPFREPVKDGTWTVEQCIRYDLADSLKGAFEQWTEDLYQGDPRDLSRDVRAALGDIGSLWRVNWDEIAAALTEEAGE